MTKWVPWIHILPNNFYRLLRRPIYRTLLPSSCRDPSPTHLCLGMGRTTRDSSTRSCSRASTTRFSSGHMLTPLRSTCTRRARSRPRCLWTWCRFFSIALLKQYDLLLQVKLLFLTNHSALFRCSVARIRQKCQRQTGFKKKCTWRSTTKMWLCKKKSFLERK